MITETEKVHKRRKYKARETSKKLKNERFTNKII